MDPSLIICATCKNTIRYAYSLYTKRLFTCAISVINYKYYIISLSNLILASRGFACVIFKYSSSCQVLQLKPPINSLCICCHII